jgi:hypothetical protein
MNRRRVLSPKWMIEGTQPIACRWAMITGQKLLPALHNFLGLRIAGEP